jgi:hypothetical protein
MLFGPAVEHATYVFLTPVLSWAFLERTGPRGGRWLIAPAFVLVMLLGWGIVSRPVMDAAPVLLTALPLGTTLLIVWLVRYGAGFSEPRTQRSGVSGGGPFTPLRCVRGSDEAKRTPLPAPLPALRR